MTCCCRKSVFLLLTSISRFKEVNRPTFRIGKINKKIYIYYVKDSITIFLFLYYTLKV